MVQEVFQELVVVGLILFGVVKGVICKLGLEIFYLNDVFYEFILLVDLLVLYLIQQICDEVYCFVIIGYCVWCGKVWWMLMLEDVFGVGLKCWCDLFKYFGGLQELLWVSIDELVKVFGISKKFVEQIYVVLYSEQNVGLFCSLDGLMNIFNLFMLLCVLFILIFILLFYLLMFWSYLIVSVVFVLVVVIDWLDGYFVWCFGQSMLFGVFFDLVVDKLMVVVVLVLLVEEYVNLWLILLVVIIIGCEIVVFVLCEWMVELGVRVQVVVFNLGKWKIVVQMLVLVIFLVNLLLMIFWVIFGYVLLIIFVVLILWFMVYYLLVVWLYLLIILKEK